MRRFFVSQLLVQSSMVSELPAKYLLLGILLLFSLLTIACSVDHHEYLYGRIFFDEIYDVDEDSTSYAVRAFIEWQNDSFSSSSVAPDGPVNSASVKYENTTLQRTRQAGWYADSSEVVIVPGEEYQVYMNSTDAPAAHFLGYHPNHLWFRMIYPEAIFPGQVFSLRYHDQYDSLYVSVYDADGDLIDQHRYTRFMFPDGESNPLPLSDTLPIGEQVMIKTRQVMYMTWGFQLRAGEYSHLDPVYSLEYRQTVTVVEPSMLEGGGR